MTYFRLFGPLLLIVGLVGCRDDVQGNGVRTVDSTLSYDEYRARLVVAIGDNGLLVVDGECGKCSVKTIDVPTEDTEILSVYGPGLTLRMMQAGAAAGSGAPLRFYLTRLDTGRARLTYHLPSHALAIFDAPDLKPLAEELDQTFARIVAAVK